MDTGAVTQESAMQNGVSLVANNLEVIDQRLSSLFNRLESVCLPSKETASPINDVKPVESPLLNQLTGMKARSDRIILSMDELLQRLQC